jgi:hypothetical protein
LKLGASFSIYGCFKHHKVGGNAVDHASLDTEQGTYIAPTLGENTDMSNLYKSSDTHEEPHAYHSAGVWGYIFQIIFQVIILLKFSCHSYSMNLNPYDSQVSFWPSPVASVPDILFFMFL